MKKPDNLYDDPGWNGFNKSYRQMEIENMHSVLREADLEKEITVNLFLLRKVIFDF